MAKDLKDQLRDWKRAHPAAPAPQARSRGGGHAAAPRARAPAKKKSDEELFREAVAGVEQDAIERKYDETPAAARVDDKKAEEELFESFVGTVKR